MKNNFFSKCVCPLLIICACFCLTCMGNYSEAVKICVSIFLTLAIIAKIIEVAIQEIE